MKYFDLRLKPPFFLTVQWRPFHFDREWVNWIERPPRLVRLKWNQIFCRATICARWYGYPELQNWRSSMYGNRTRTSCTLQFSITRIDVRLSVWLGMTASEWNLLFHQNEGQVNTLHSAICTQSVLTKCQETSVLVSVDAWMRECWQVPSHTCSFKSSPTLRSECSC